jgi:hypothetical protein
LPSRCWSKHQLRILNRGRKRAPNLRATERFIAGLCIVHEPGTRFAFRHRPEAIHAAASPPRAGQTKVPHIVFAPAQASACPKGPNKELIDAVVELKRRNRNWGCPRIAQQIALLSALPSTRMWFAVSSAFITGRNRIREALPG